MKWIIGILIGMAVAFALGIVAAIWLMHRSVKDAVGRGLGW